MLNGQIDNRNISEILKEKKYLLTRISNFGQKHGWNSFINEWVNNLTAEVDLLKEIEAEDLEIWEENKILEIKPDEFSKPSQKELSFLIECILEDAEILNGSKDERYIDIPKENITKLLEWLSKKVIKLDFSEEYKKGLL